MSECVCVCVCVCVYVCVYFDHLDLYKLKQITAKKGYAALINSGFNSSIC